MRRRIVTLLALFLSAGLPACSDAEEPGGVPEAPSELRVTFVASSGVLLTWNDASDEQKYVVKRQAVGVDNGFVVIAELEADVVGYTDTKVMSGKTYRYLVLSENPYGESSSEEASIDVP